MKELKVGERVTITLEAVERKNSDRGCRDCFFGDVSKCLGISCRSYERSDGKSVIFKEVKE